MPRGGGGFRGGFRGGGGGFRGGFNGGDRGGGGMGESFFVFLFGSSLGREEMVWEERLELTVVGSGLFALGGGFRGGFNGGGDRGGGGFGSFSSLVFVSSFAFPLSSC